MSDLISEILGGDTFTLDASFGGVPFAMIDSRDGPGRRALKFLFPGLDTPAFQDLGQDDAEIPITGIIVGPDYIQRAEDLRSAFRTPGPQTLVHPWLGNIQVVLIGKPEISFSHEELNVVRFTAKFALFTASQPQSFDTQEGLLDQLNDLRQAAYGLLGQVLSAASQVLSVVSYVQNFAGSVVGFFNSAVADVSGVTSELLGPAAAPALAALGTVGTLPLGDGFAASLFPLLAGPSAAMVMAAQPPIPAAIAPGGNGSTASASTSSVAASSAAAALVVAAAVTPSTAADARITTTLLLGVATSVAGKSIDPAPGPALALVTQALVVADALTAASDIVYTSQQDAAQWLATLLTAVDALSTAAMVQGGAYPALAGAIWRASVGSASALSEDMNAQIGRLPAVVVINPPGSQPVWLLAQYLSGDTPSLVFATYLDLVQRNGIENPGLAPAGPIETLQQT